MGLVWSVGLDARGTSAAVASLEADGRWIRELGLVMETMCGGEWEGFSARKQRNAAAMLYHCTTSAKADSLIVGEQRWIASVEFVGCRVSELGPGGRVDGFAARLVLMSLSALEEAAQPPLSQNNHLGWPAAEKPDQPALPNDNLSAREVEDAECQGSGSAETELLAELGRARPDLIIVGNSFSSLIEQGGHEEAWIELMRSWVEGSDEAVDTVLLTLSERLEASSAATALVRTVLSSLVLRRTLGLKASATRAFLQCVSSLAKLSPRSGVAELFVEPLLDNLNLPQAEVLSRVAKRELIGARGACSAMEKVAKCQWSENTLRVVEELVQASGGDARVVELTVQAMARNASGLAASNRFAKLAITLLAKHKQATLPHSGLLSVAMAPSKSFLKKSVLARLPTS